MCSVSANNSYADLILITFLWYVFTDFILIEIYFTPGISKSNSNYLLLFRKIRTHFKFLKTSKLNIEAHNTY